MLETHNATENDGSIVLAKQSADASAFAQADDSCTAVHGDDGCTFFGAEAASPVSAKSCLLYPHPSLPLVPKALLPLLGSRSIIAPDGQSRAVSDFTDIKSSDLSEKAFSMACEQIADTVQTILYSRKCIEKMAQMPINVPQGVRLSGLILSDRARVALQSREFFGPNGPWRDCTLRDLVSTHALGAKLLLAFLLAIEHGIGDPNGTEQPAALQPSLSTHLEDDLRAVVADVLYADRSADVFTFANGWDGGGERLLGDISARHGVSKERARQILLTSEISVKSRVQAMQAPERLRRALEILESASPISVKQANAALHAAGLTRGEFNPHGVLTAARMFSIRVTVQIKKTGRLAIVCTPHEGAHLRALQSLARSMARSFGLVSDQWVKLRALQTNQVIEPNHIRLALQSDAKMQELVVDASGAHWFWLGHSSKSKPSGAVVRPLKTIAFFGGATLKSMMADLESDFAAADLEFPGGIHEQALAALLDRWGMSAGTDSIWRTANQKGIDMCRMALPAVEKQMAEIVLRAGGEMNKSDFQIAAMKEQINPNTVQSYLRRSPLFAHDGSRSRTVALASFGNLADNSNQ